MDRTWTPHVLVRMRCGHLQHIREQERAPEAHRCDRCGERTDVADAAVVQPERRAA